MRLSPSVFPPLSARYREAPPIDSVSALSLSETPAVVPVRSGRRGAGARYRSRYTHRVVDHYSNHDFRRVATHARVVPALVAGLAPQSACLAQARDRVGARQYRRPPPLHAGAGLRHRQLPPRNRRDEVHRVHRHRYGLPERNVHRVVRSDVLGIFPHAHAADVGSDHQRPAVARRRSFRGVDVGREQERHIGNGDPCRVHGSRLWPLLARDLGSAARFRDRHDVRRVRAADEFARAWLRLLHLFFHAGVDAHPAALRRVFSGRANARYATNGGRDSATFSRDRYRAAAARGQRTGQYRPAYRGAARLCMRCLLRRAGADETTPPALKKNAMLWVKSLHIVFMVTWFAGLFYLPRLFVYHAQAHDAIGIERFKLMERKLYFGIMTPGAVLTVAFGLWLWLGYGISGGWLYAKLALVAILVAHP